MERTACQERRNLTLKWTGPCGKQSSKPHYFYFLLDWRIETFHSNAESPRVRSHRAAPLDLFPREGDDRDDDAEGDEEEGALEVVQGQFVYGRPLVDLYGFLSPGQGLLFHADPSVVFPPEKKYF